MRSELRQRYRVADLRTAATYERRLTRNIQGILNKKVRYLADIVKTHGTLQSHDIMMYNEEFGRAFMAQVTATVSKFYQLSTERMGKIKSVPIVERKNLALTYAQRYATSRVGEMLTTVNDTTLQLLRGIVQRAIDEGGTTDDIAREFINRGITMNRARARTIARTEVHRAMTNGSMQAAIDAPFQTTKTWTAKIDNATRSDHVQADGQTVPTIQPFSVGGYDIMVPGEGPADQAINCRCTVVYEPAE